MGPDVENNSINFEDMVKQLAKPGTDIVESMTGKGAHLMHMAIGISGEAGEMIDAIKKHVIYGKELDHDNVVEEFGDLEFYMEGLRESLNITREETLKANVAKLGKRYKDHSYSDQQAHDRADKNDMNTQPHKPLDRLKSPVTMNFSDALHAAKAGRKIARLGWNGNGMFLYHVPASTFKVNRPPLLGIYDRDHIVAYNDHMDMVTADGSISTWLCSQSDMFASDWFEVE